MTEQSVSIEPKTSSTKPEIRQLILPVLVTKNTVGEESDEKTEEKENTEEKEYTETSTMMVKTRKYDQEFELEKLKLQMELEKMRLEKEEKEKERQEREKERKTGKRKCKTTTGMRKRKTVRIGEVEVTTIESSHWAELRRHQEFPGRTFFSRR